MTSRSAEIGHFEVGIAPVADFMDTVQSTDIVNMKNHGRVRFIVFWGVGTTGTATLTVEACDDVTPSNSTAVPFRYRRTAALGTPGAVTAATTSGFTTTAGSNQIYEVEVDAEDVASTGFGYVRLKCTEVVNSPVLGGVLISMERPGWKGAATESSVI